MGPIVLFDKSFIEMLNVDEAALFDFLFLTNICPMFMTEVLADLEKERPGERTREKIVADLARKTPAAHSYPNLLHASICLTELHGRPIEMDRRPVLPGGRPVRHERKLGMYYEESAEMKAYSRWQDGRFLEVERDYARYWRAQLMSADLAQIAALARCVVNPIRSKESRRSFGHCEGCSLRRPKPLSSFQGRLCLPWNSDRSMAEGLVDLEGSWGAAAGQACTLHSALSAG
jgi:hypothetical protein